MITTQHRTRHSEQRAERRRCRRLPCRAPVRIYVTPGRISHCLVLNALDLSPSGVFLRTGVPFAIGRQLELEYVVPGRALPVRGRGSVVRVDGDSGPLGPGIAVHISGN